LARKNGQKRNKSRGNPTLERARDELYSAIRQCGVMEVPVEEQGSWMDETLEYMLERHPELLPAELEQLKQLGMRFCMPVIQHGRDHTAVTTQDANAA